MNHAFLRPEPPQLRIRSEAPPETGEIRRNVIEPPTDHEVTERSNRGHADLVAASDRERQAVAVEAIVGAQDHVGGRVVGIDVDGVGAGLRP